MSLGATFLFLSGWLKHAEISHSGMNLYLENGQKLPEQGEEEGELNDPVDKAEFDIEKLVDWPGFNTPLPKEFRDDTERHRVPPLSRCQTLEVGISEYLQKQFCTLYQTTFRSGFDQSLAEWWELRRGFS
jgi:hypothetical protein